MIKEISGTLLGNRLHKQYPNLVGQGQGTIHPAGTSVRPAQLTGYASTVFRKTIIHVTNSLSSSFVRDSVECLLHTSHRLSGCSD